MTFNQWAAGRDLNDSMRFAFEAVWRELIDRGCTSADRLLSDVFEAMPQSDLAEYEEDLF